jgi:hypothetical protein
MRCLAWDLDHLERHIDWFGSVTAKVPDVWGQARLTQYRQDFESQMNGQLGKFQFTLNGSISRTDQAYFASATALSFATQPQAPFIGSVTNTQGNAPSLVPTSQTVAQVTKDAAGNTTTTTTNLGQPSATPFPTPVTAPGATTDPTKLLATNVTSTDPIKRNDATLPTLLGFGSNAAIQIEPTEYLAQMKRYLDLLAQFRRENEGDDTADSPGYSINVMRMPVSILPGKRTDVGFGSEITMTASPVLGPELLPMTFRTLLNNDIVNQLGFPLTQILNQVPASQGAGRYLTSTTDRFLLVFNRLFDYYSMARQQDGGYRLSEYVRYLYYNRTGNADLQLFKKLAPQDLITILDNYALDLRKSPMTMQMYQQNQGKQNNTNNTNIEPFEKKFTADRIQQAVLINSPQIATQLALPSLSFSSGLDNRTAFPTSQILNVYGPQFALAIGYGAEQAFQASIAQQGYAHLPDIQGYLKEEGRAAYQFLEKNPSLWHNYCTPQLVQAIRSQQWDLVVAIRQQYRTEVAYLTGSDSPDVNRFDPAKDPLQYSKTTALAWGLIVDASLLNDRLLKDIRETASTKNKPLPGCDHWCPYFLPDPPPDCRLAFNEYVNLRWPVRVFALDPYIQEQNIADTLSTRRETQLALAIAFTNGLINANQLTKFSRRLEADYQTIALNRTQVGFSHGENVFGWRFYPRFQTPDTDSNLTVFLRDNLIGGPNRNQLLRQRRLEPGIRECVAVVLMPSFVPTVTVDTVSNWFPLTNPKHKVLDHSQAIRLSRTVQTIKNEGCGVKDASHYRPGEMERLIKRADQLEAKLPTQTLITPVPVLNTYGGFEMFANGTTDLAPELFGWYGAPGIDPTAASTTLFLVGDHFSPLRTQVIVGNEPVTSQTLLSRQVIQVTFAKGTYSLSGPSGSEVRIHLATPYGVTRELSVPMVTVKPSPKAGFTVAPATLTIPYASNPAAQKSSTPSGAAASTPAVATNSPNSATPAASPQFVALSQSSQPSAPPLNFTWVGGDPTATITSSFMVSFVFSVPATTAGGTATTVTVPLPTVKVPPPSTSGAAATSPSTTTTTVLNGATATLKVTNINSPGTPTNGGTLSIASDQIDGIAADLFSQPAVQQLASAGLLANGLTTSQILVMPLGSDGKPTRTVATNDQLTVQFNLVSYSATQLAKQPPPATPKAAAAAPKASSAGFKVSDSSQKLSVPYCKSGAMGGKYYLGLMELPDTARPKLQWVVSDGNPPPQKIHVEFTFKYKGCDLVVPVDMTPGPDGLYTTAADKSDTTTWKLEVWSGLFLQLNAFGPFDDSPMSSNPNPLVPDNKLLSLTKISVTSSDPNMPITPTPVVLMDKDLPMAPWPPFTCKICDASTPPLPVVPGVPAPATPAPVVPGATAPVAPGATSSAASVVPAPVSPVVPVPTPLPVAPVLVPTPSPLPNS